MAESPSVDRGERQSIANATYGRDLGLGSAAPKLRAQSRHVDVHNVRAGVEVQVPHLFEQYTARDDLIGVQDQILEKAELLGCQGYRLPRNACLVLETIHDQIPK